MRRTVTETTSDVPPAVVARRRDRLTGRAVVDRQNAPVGAGGTVAAGAGNGLLLLARLIRFVTGVLAAIIIAAILLRVLDANASNTIVSDIHDLARSLVGPFDGMFDLRKAKVELAVNWGIAAVVYLVVGNFIAGLIARAGLAGAARG